MQLRSRLAALAFAVLVAASAGEPAVAQQPAPNPTAQSANEQQLMQELRKIEGRVSIPDPRAGTLEQPQGREYQQFHERVLPWLGAIVIIGAILALAVFYLVRGPITLDSPPTGIKIKRFSWFERFNHWLTATSFLVLAITGLNYVFGKRLLMPLIGPDAFATWSQWAKLAHNAFAWPFLLGLFVMFVIWIRDNIPDRYDLEWLRQFGGFLSHRHPPARRFNAGQKLIYWSVVLGGIAMTATGLVMLFPFLVENINTIQTTQYVHAIAGVILTAIIIGHIYIGTIGMRGASDAMLSGEVDLAWAKEHHRVWVDEEGARTLDGPQVQNRPVPAE